MYCLLRFKAFLSADMNYSSAIFEDFREDLASHVKNPEPLESAQMRKMQYVYFLIDVSYA
jgi:cyclopropane fatty-acyl-phospholipid synthase-like methyltransferase